MKKIMTTFLILLNLVVFAQEKKWVTEAGEKAKKGETNFYNTLEKINDSLFVSKSYKNDRLFLKEEYLDESRKIKNGRWISYFTSNGQLKESWLYKNNRPIKLVAKYKENGEDILEETLSEVIEIPIKKDFPDDEIFAISDDSPEFPGGMGEMMKYIAYETANCVKVKANNLKGKVYINFVVEKDGTLSNIKKVNYPGEQQNETLVIEAIKIVSKMAKWKPGANRGKTVRVKYTIPVTFK